MKVTIIDELIGQVAKTVTNDHDLELIFELENGQTARFYHEQECCESVSIEEIHGDLNDLVGQKIVQAEFVYEDVANIKHSKGSLYDSATWTFYKFATNKGSVTVRWYGTSNGFYSEAVDFECKQTI